MGKIQLFQGDIVITDGLSASQCELVVEDGIIKKLLPNSKFRDHIELEDFDKVTKGKYIIPGFVDIHCHGIGGANNLLDYWLSDFTTSLLPSYGTTSVLSSLTFPKDDIERTRTVIDHLNKNKCGKLLFSSNCVTDSEVTQQKYAQTVIEGIHAEGPIIETCAGLPPSNSMMDLQEFKTLIDSMPFLKIMTISPTLDYTKNFEKTLFLIGRNVRPAFGHDQKATEETIKAAMRVIPENYQLHITHLFNVCSFHHRSVGLVNFGLLNRFPASFSSLNQINNRKISPFSVEIIADGVHVHPLTLQMLLDTKNREDISIITDAVMSSIVASNGVEYGGRKLEAKIMDDGKARIVLEGTKTIAGSCANQLEMFHSLYFDHQIPLVDCCKMLSTNPARIANLTNVGSLKVGNRCDLLILDEKLNLVATYINGIEGKISHATKTS